MQTTRPGYDLSTADLNRAAIPRDTLARIVMQAAQSDRPNDYQLLSALLLTARPKNTLYLIRPFAQLNVGGTAIRGYQQILPENLARRALIIAHKVAGAGNQFGYVLQQTEPTYQNCSISGVPAPLLAQTVSAGHIVTFLEAPTSAVTIVWEFNNPPDIIHNGIILEGY